jgi:predicted  nucleic acid-binding Zn-ribbon protein
MENVRIAIRDSTDSHNVAFFDNISGIRYQSANLQRFLAGSASILTIEYNSKDIDTIRTGCKLAFIYKGRPYWLNIMDLSKKGYKVEITAYSIGLELNQEERGAHKPANAMSFVEYLAYYDPEHALELGINEVADKRIKLEWTGTDTILARLFSIANSFDAELEFTVELNQDYSLKRQVLNVYKKGNLGSNRAASPIRVGRGLKVINYSDNLKELRTAVRATGKDGLTLDGLNKKVYDDDGNLLYYSNVNTVYAPQSRDKYPSVGKKSNDNWIIKELGETEYSTKEALWGYMLGELKKICLPEITYDIEGAINGDVGDTRTLIDDVHYDPPLYVQARISELTEDLITGRVTKSTLTNFERKYSQVASELLKQVEALAEDAAPYIVRLSTDNGYNFKNGQGSSTITAKLEKYSKIVNADWKWLINNSIVSEKSSVTINASQVTGTLNVVAVATVDGNEVAREYITFTNSDDGVGIKSIKRYYTTNDQAEGVTAGGQNWSTKPTTVTADKNYMWSYDVITYTNDTSLVTEPAVIGARGDDGLDADTTGITEALDKVKQELTALSANIEKVRDDSLAAVNEAKEQLAAVANDLSKAKTDLQNAVSAVDAKATNLQTDLTKAKQDLTSQASQLTEQANAQSELTKRVSTVEETANGTKSTVSELTKTVAQNGKDITSVTARTKTVEDDLLNTKTTLSQVKTTADSTSQKTATLETGLNGLSAKFSNLRVGGVNLIKQSTAQTGLRLGMDAGPFPDSKHALTDWIKIEPSTVYTLTTYEDVTETNMWYSLAWYSSNVNDYSGWISRPTGAATAADLKGGKQYTSPANATYAKVSYPNNYPKVKLERGNIATDYSPSEADIEQKVADYKQTADQNYASLQTTVQNLDGTVQQNKTVADQTAQGFSTRIESLETYKNSENIRANQYFEIAKTETARQLTAERTAIAKDYVAKSTYTSDVTGIRNDLSATTTTASATKTNLANYQASNDKAVANLQSNLQTANGNISSLKTKVEAVPGQITSAVSAVEGKIPKSLGGRNLIIRSQIQNGYIDANGNLTTATSQFTTGFIDGTNSKQFTITAPKFVLGNLEWLRLAKYDTNKNFMGRDVISYNKDAKTVKNIDLADNVAYFKVSFDGAYGELFKIERGSLATDWSPAPEDAIEEISSLSSQIQQTADGMTLLATKTELNTAKSDLQSGISTATSKADSAQATANNNAQTISTHTTQISALNTGLQAKVSQSDFNTLSGRVTTAESNLTATANQLSSKITSVEGKIPKSVGGANLFKGSRDFSGTDWVNKDSGIYAEDYQGVKIFKKQTLWDGFSQYFEVKTGEEYVFSAYVKSSAKTDRITFYLVHGSKQPQASGVVSFNSANSQDAVTFDLTDEYQRIAIKIKITKDGWIMPRLERYNSDAYLFFGSYKLERGNIPTDWSPAPEDYDSKLATAQSEIKQTTDAITASVSSIQTTASNAQSTANTAVSKADAAQAGVNTLDSTTVKSASLTINTDGIVMKAGKSTTDVANAIGSYFAVNQNAINLFSDKIKVKGDMIVDGAITSNKISAGAITANMISGGQLRSTNGATVFDLNGGTLTFNNNYGYIQRVANDKIFEITTYLGKDTFSQEYLTSAFNIRKSDNSRQAGVKFTLFNTVENKPTSEAKINADAFILYDSKDTRLFSVHGKNTFSGTSNTQDWGDIPIAEVYGGLLVKDIGIGGHIKPLLKIVEELCQKTGILWV